MVEFHAAVVVLVARRYRARRRMHRVIEAIPDPRDRRALRVRDPFSSVASGLRLDHEQRRELIPTTRHAVRDEASIERRVIPVEGGEALLVEDVRVDQGAVVSGDASSHIEHRLLLRSLAPGVEDPWARRPRRGEQTDREQVTQARCELRTCRHGIQRKTCACVLRVGPCADAVGLSLEPPVRIGDAVAVPRVDDFLARRLGRRRDPHRQRVPATPV